MVKSKCNHLPEGLNVRQLSDLKLIQFNKIIMGSAEVGESGRTVNPLPRAEWVRIPPPQLKITPR